MPDALLIVAQKDYQSTEYSDTRKELEAAGLSIEVASITSKEAVGKDGSRLTPDLAVKDAKVNDYKAIVIIGGPGAPVLGNYGEVLDLIKDADEKGKIIAAICIAPTILAKSGILKGKKATVWNGDGKQGTIIESAGAKFTDEDVTVDGNIITANGPSAARKFGKTVAKAVIDKESAD